MNIHLYVWRKNQAFFKQEAEPNKLLNSLLSEHYRDRKSVYKNPDDSTGMPDKTQKNKRSRRAPKLDAATITQPPEQPQEPESEEDLTPPGGKYAIVITATSEVMQDGLSFEEADEALLRLNANNDMSIVEQTDD